MNWNEVDAFRDRLVSIRCPFCGASGSLGKHGSYEGYIDDLGTRGVRGKRVRCRRVRGGCGISWSIRLGDRLFRHCFSTKQLWSFLQELLAGRSVKSAWEVSGIGLSVEAAYRIVKRLKLLLPVLRSRLFGRDPPANKCAGSPLLQMLAHLRELFGDSDPICGFQRAFQIHFFNVI